MSTGKTHDKITIYSSIALAIVIWICFSDLEAGIVAAIGNLFGGLWLSPSLVRVLYLSTPVLILTGLLGIGHEALDFAFKHSTLIAIWILGIEFSSVAHLAADGILFGKIRTSKK